MNLTAQIHVQYLINIGLLEEIVLFISDEIIIRYF